MCYNGNLNETLQLLENDMALIRIGAWINPVGYWKSSQAGRTPYHFQVLSKRWIVGRSFGWLENSVD